MKTAEQFDVAAPLRRLVGVLCGGVLRSRALTGMGLMHWAAMPLGRDAFERRGFELTT